MTTPWQECPPELMEKLAALEHERWSGWMKYQFSKGTFMEKLGEWTMPEWAVKRWTRQSSTAYAPLSELEKEEDRKEARKSWDVIAKFLKQDVERRDALERLWDAVRRDHFHHEQKALADMAKAIDDLNEMARQDG